MTKAEKRLRALHRDMAPIAERMSAASPGETIGQVVDPGGMATMRLSADALRDAANILADHADQAKARRERIQWVSAGPDLHVAAIGRLTARLRWSGSGTVGRVWMHNGAARVHDLGHVTSIEGATRKVRAWRKAQRRAS